MVGGRRRRRHATPRSPQRRVHDDRYLGTMTRRAQGNRHIPQGRTHMETWTSDTHAATGQVSNPTRHNNAPLAATPCDCDEGGSSTCVAAAPRQRLVGAGRPAVTRCHNNKRRVAATARRVPERRGTAHTSRWRRWPATATASRLATAARCHAPPRAPHLHDAGRPTAAATTTHTRPPSPRHHGNMHKRGGEKPPAARKSRRHHRAGVDTPRQGQVNTSIVRAGAEMWRGFAWHSTQPLQMVVMVPHTPDTHTQPQPQPRRRHTSMSAGSMPSLQKWLYKVSFPSNARCDCRGSSGLCLCDDVAAVGVLVQGHAARAEVL